MKRVIFVMFVILLALPGIFALDLSIEKKSLNDFLVVGTNLPAVFDLKIINYGLEENVVFYNLLGFKMFPIGTVNIGEGQTKDVELKISPIGDLKNRGAYTFSYFIRGEDSSQIMQELNFKIVELEDVFELGSDEINPETNSFNFYLHNKISFDFEKIDVKFTSAFFDSEESFSLGPNKRKDFTVDLNKEDFKKLKAGFYTLNAEVTVGEKTVLFEHPVKFAPKGLIATQEENYGLIINTKIIRKINEGNVLTRSEINFDKNIFSRLFTNFNVDPDVVKRDGLRVYYTWSSEIKPGESLEIVVKTNWLFPLIIIFLVMVILILIRQNSMRDVVLRKKITFVKAKGGEFALKVSVYIHSKKYVENVSIIDRLPPLIKVYEKFGVNEPLRVDEKNKRIEWMFEKLEEGETRVLSYFIYSKIGILGKFALPVATAIYERNGKLSESKSNRAFFVAEQKKNAVEY